MKEMDKFSLVEILGFCCHSLFHLRSGELEPRILHAFTAFLRVKQAVESQLLFLILSLAFLKNIFFLFELSKYLMNLRNGKGSK